MLVWKDRARQTGQHKSRTHLWPDWQVSRVSPVQVRAAFPGLVSPGSVGRRSPPFPSAPSSKGVCDPVMTYDLFNGPPEPHLSFPTIPLPFSSQGKLEITGKEQWKLPPATRLAYNLSPVNFNTVVLWQEQVDQVFNMHCAYCFQHTKLTRKLIYDDFWEVLSLFKTNTTFYYF